MTLQCTRCDSYSIHIIDDNGATDGETTRTERYKCEDCGNKFANVLSSSPAASYESTWSSSNDWYNY
jgi:hypothetical protein